MVSKDPFLERRCGPCRMLTVVMVVLLSATIVVSATLIATTFPVGASINKKLTVGVSSDAYCLDIAVIGGGMGGAYTGWRLKDRGHTISVFEYSDRVGGRIFTAKVPTVAGTYVELGGMRFKSGAHPILNRTVTSLGLNIIPFSFGFGNADETIWYTRDTHMRNTDLGTNKTPFNLNKEEQKDPDTLLWELFKNNVNITDTYPSLEQMYSLTTSDGTPLYHMSYDNFLGQYASREAYKYELDTSGWADAVGRQGALHGPKVFLSYPGNTGPSEGYKTIEGGMSKVPQTLMEKFLEASTKHELHLNHQLMKIEKRQAGGYNLGFRKTQTTDGITTPVQTGDPNVVMCARKVVLAVERECIQDIDFPGFKDNPEIVKNLDSVFSYPAGKIFLAYNTTWWKTGNPDITHTRSDLPNRQTYDWSTGTNNVSIILASYHDGDLAHYWRELSQFGTPIPGSLPGANAVTDVVKKRVEKYLSAIYNVSQSDIPEAVGGAMMLWDKYPFQAAWSYFKPGFDERKVRDLIAKPSPSDDVHIVSNSWAADDLQGWIEGTLRAVDVVISKYLPESG
ncbi:L-amino-acid oxidase-like [Haliotis rufescens]|uniref:L-amino-acid oxidase-like n=1 Tax=Haliotis rufescens TaxID=6454 RepID=UPI00201F1C13|nr:L-amino-acid oxidase-like [Haliotis rufescens]XP_046330466.2 L-amino-acid oxidase-like [Haliotis rufescens]